LKAGGVLAFDGKTKEKGIPTNANISLHPDMRGVPHLVTLDLVVLE